MLQACANDKKDTYVIGHHQAQLDWANEALADKGIIGQWQPVRSMPWSSVSYVETREGRVFLKSMAKPFAKEATILALLEKYTPGCTTRLVAVNDTLQCFLMYDAGSPLREALLAGFRMEYQELALTMCAEVQVATLPYVQEFLNAGVNDWRLKRIPLLYQKFINDRVGVLEGYGMSCAEIECLRKLVFPISDECLKLLTCNVPETLEHADFQDNNILVTSRPSSRGSKKRSDPGLFLDCRASDDTRKDGSVEFGSRLVIGDWGDASISHPFFSCVSFLESAKRHHRLTAEMEEHLIQIYLKKWQEYGALKDLRRAYASASKLYYVIVGMSHVRFYDCLNVENFPEYRDFAPKALMQLKEAMNRNRPKL